MVKRGQAQQLPESSTYDPASPQHRVVYDQINDLLFKRIPHLIPKSNFSQRRVDSQSSISRIKQSSEQMLPSIGVKESPIDMRHKGSTPKLKPTRVFSPEKRPSVSQSQSRVPSTFPSPPTNTSDTANSPVRRASAFRKKYQAKQRQENIDTIARTRNQSFRGFVAEYRKRVGIGDETKIFVLQGPDDHIRRALLRANWAENSNSASPIFHLKWTTTDIDRDYSNLQPGQKFNHFPGNRAITTKSGLTKLLQGRSRNYRQCSHFFPASYDIGEKQDLSDFTKEFQRNQVLKIVKRHVEFWDKNDPSTCVVNKVVLAHIVEYLKTLIQLETTNCENQSKYEFIQKNVDWFKVSDNMWRCIQEYSEFLPAPGQNPSQSEKLLSCTRSDELDVYWQIPTQYLITDLKAVYDQLDLRTNPCRNIWVLKPGQNSKGSGVKCCDSLDKIRGSVRKMNARVVQKYVESPMLLHVPELAHAPVKFDIRQWVLVTSFEPLVVYMFDACYLRLCSSPFTLDDIRDPFKHLANYSVQGSKIGFADVSTGDSSTVGAESIVWSLSQFVAYLHKHKSGKSWDFDILPAI